ncbi:MAG: hypothetical protein LBG96_09575 [Tannerella sp.]|nr:hypothetical protein [Tannerella sp.]
MTRAEFYEWISDPSLLTKNSLQELRQMVDDFPYFHAVRMLYLKNLAVLDDVRLEKELRKMSVYVPDRRLLFLLINDRLFVGKKERTSPAAEINKTEKAFEVIEKATPSDGPDEKDFVSTLLSKPISSAVATSDYVNWLEENAEDLPAENGTENRLKHQDLIDSFMANESDRFAQRLGGAFSDRGTEADNERERPKQDALEKISLDDSYFTETLARVYIDQKRYDKALEIIRVLNLKYPEKNIYFADQIRYLEKIINIKK